MQAKACRHEITVVIPTYNRCLLLKRAIHSVYQQTVTPREVIVVDDGSTDKTQVQLKSLFPQVIWKPRRIKESARPVIVESKKRRVNGLHFLIQMMNGIHKNLNFSPNI